VALAGDDELGGPSDERHFELGRLERKHATRGPNQLHEQPADVSASNSKKKPGVVLRMLRLKERNSSWVATS